MNFREERAAKRRLEILHTAARIFREKGYYDTTIEEIANELKFTKGSIYYYVPSKEHLLFECHDMAMSLLLTRIEPVAGSIQRSDKKLKEMIKRHIETLVDEISLITVLLQQEYALNEEHHQIIVDKRDKYEQLFVKVLESGVAEGVFRPTDLHLVKLIFFGASNWMMHWYAKSGRLTKKEIATFFAEYLVAPLLM